VLSAHHQIVRYASEKGMLDTPRTTVVAAIVERGCVHWVHCGDSRLYLVRDGQLLTRTRDHSYSEQQANLGQFDSSINRNVLFTCLGSPQRPIYDLSAPVPLQQGDKLLLCSDGLWSALPDHEIVNVLSANPVGLAVPELAERALRKAGDSSDNVTVLALEWETPDAFQDTGGVSTDSITDGMFQSTIQAPEIEQGQVDLDDDDIERNIAEINEAIRRTAARKA
jgi:serine/threonine protein phosphatase PrpC